MTAKELPQSIARVSRETLDGAIARFMRVITELPSTNWLLWTGTIAGLLTCFVYLTCLVIDTLRVIAPGQSRPAIDPVTFGMWLAFLGSWMGIGVKQFQIKRKTHSTLSPQAQQAEPAA